MPCISNEYLPIHCLFYLGLIPSSWPPWSLPVWNTDLHTGSDQTVEVAKTGNEANKIKNCNIDSDQTVGVAKTGNEASIRSKTATLTVIKYWSEVAKA